MRGSLAIAVCLALLSACRAPTRSSPEEIETYLRGLSTIVVKDECLELHSPLAAGPTAVYESVLREETALVRTLFPEAHTYVPRFYLAPTEREDTNVEPWEHATRDGFGGFAFETGFALVFVTADANPNEAAMQAETTRSSVRHEVTHLFARATGLVGARWFREGLACEVESRTAAGGRLHETALHEDVIEARDTARVGSTSELLAWSDNERPVADTQRFYRESLALFRYLHGRASGDWIERSRAVLALEPDAIRALEGEWLAWLGRIDAVDAIRAGHRSEWVEERIGTATLLPVLAERQVSELDTREADELALELMLDPVTRDSAATFLLYFRAKDLRSEDVEWLSGSKDPVVELTALALRERRGEPYDERRASELWSHATQEQRFSAYPQATLLGLVGGENRR